VLARLAEVADARGRPPAQIALAWLLRKTGVTAPIVGTTTIAPLEEAPESGVGARSMQRIAEHEDIAATEPDQPVPGEGGLDRLRLVEMSTQIEFFSLESQG
jgi:aryl-alcohol dehydrogenase-like predicted oxidoreductase